MLAASTRIVAIDDERCPLIIRRGDATHQQRTSQCSSKEEEPNKRTHPSTGGGREASSPTYALNNNGTFVGSKVRLRKQIESFRGVLEKPRFTDFFGPTLRKQTRFFDFRVFFFELLTHVFFPLSTPLVCLAQSVTAAENKGFLPCRHNRFFFTASLSTFLLTFLPLGLVLGLNQLWLIPAVCVVIVLRLFRDLVIAGKYACYCPPEYQQVIAQKGFMIAPRILAACWGQNIIPEVIEDHLFYAQWANSLSVSLDHAKLRLIDGSEVLCEDYLREALAKTFGRPLHMLPWRVVKFGLCFCVGIIPAVQFVLLATHENREVLRVHRPDTFHLDAWSVIATLACVLATLAAIMPCLWFTECAVLHYARHYRCQQALVDAVVFAPPPPPDDGDGTTAAVEGLLQHCDDKMIPLLGYPTNLLNWTAMLWTAQSFGKRMERRINFNCLATCVINGCLLLVLAYEAFIDKSRQPALIFVTSTLFLFLTVAVFLCAYFAMQANGVAGSFTTMLTQQEFVHVMSHHSHAHEEEDASAAHDVLGASNKSGADKKKEDGEGASDAQQQKQQPSMMTMMDEVDDRRSNGTDDLFNLNASSVLGGDRPPRGGGRHAASPSSLFGGDVLSRHPALAASILGPTRHHHLLGGSRSGRPSSFDQRGDEDEEETELDRLDNERRKEEVSTLEKLLALREHLDLARELMERTVGNAPYRVLYMEASFGLLTALASVALTGLVMLFTIFCTSFDEKWMG